MIISRNILHFWIDFMDRFFIIIIGKSTDIMSVLKKKFIIGFLKHPKLSFKPILHTIRATEGNLFETNQGTQLYIMPADFFQRVRRETIKTAGIDLSKSLIYISNQSSADIILNDAKVLGLKGEEQIKYFFGILAVFGWGQISDFKFDPETHFGSFKALNFPMLKDFADITVHYDLAGIIARVIELVYQTRVMIQEELCVERKDPYCLFKIMSKNTQKADLKIDYLHRFGKRIDVKILADSKFLNELLDRIQMPTEGVLLIDNDPDKRVVIKDNASINQMVNENIKILGDKTVGGVFYRCARETNFPFSTLCQSCEEIESLFDHLSLMGWGQYKLQEIRENAHYQVSVRNSPFIVGITATKEPICYSIGGTLHQIFERYLKTPKILVREEKCVIKGDPECIFTIKTF